MQSLLIRERYKVIRVLDARESYAFAEAVDILDREKQSYLLNMYEGELLRAYLPHFHSIGVCPAFQGMFVEGETLVTVFKNAGGRCIDQVFYRGDRHGWRERLDYAELLLHEALCMADLPPAIGCAALLSQNVLFDEEERRLRLRFKVEPLDEMNARELALLAGDQAYKILRPRLGSPMVELGFLDELAEGRCLNVVQLYALWRERRPQIEEAYAALLKKNFVGRWSSLLWGRVKRALARRKGR